MKVELNKKTVRWLLIALVVIVIVGFIWWRQGSKSTYAIADAIDSTKTDYNATLKDTLNTCQNNFVTSTLGTVIMHSGAACSGGTVTVTTILPHNYSTGNQVYVQGISSDGTGANPVTGFNSPTTVSTNNSGVTSVTLDSTVSVTKVDATTFTYPDPTGSCSTVNPTTYGYSWNSASAGNSSVMTAFNTRTTCMGTAISTFLNSKCPWAVPDGNGNFPTPASSDSADVKTANTTHQTQLTTIKTAYAGYVQTFMANGTQASLQAARLADFTGSTRQYFNAACPRFYKLNGTSDPGAASVTISSQKILMSPYSSYEAYSTTPVGSTLTSYFDGSKVTQANITNWYQVYTKYVTTNPTKKLSQLTSADIVAGANASAFLTALQGAYSSDGTVGKLIQEIGPGTQFKVGSLTSYFGILDILTTT